MFSPGYSLSVTRAKVHDLWTRHAHLAIPKPGENIHKFTCYQNFFFHIFSLKNIILYRNNPIIKKKLKKYRKITLPFFFCPTIISTGTNEKKTRNSKERAEMLETLFFFPLAIVARSVWEDSRREILKQS